MEMYKIDVDEEIYRYLQSKAEPFVDTENSVLRRILLADRARAEVKEQHAASFPKFPPGTPDGLTYILELVYLLVRDYAANRIEAAKKVAEYHGVTYPTVADKYARQLGKSTYEVDRMLEETGFNELKTLLENKFRPFTEIIHEFFKGLNV